MKVNSKQRLIELLDEAIALGEQLHTVLDGFETIMKGSICCNTQVSSGVPNHR